MLRSRKNFWMKTRLSRTIRSGSRPTRFVLFPRMRFFSEQNSPQKTRRRKEFCGCNQKYESCSDNRNREAGQETLKDPERVQQDSPGRQPWEHRRGLDRALKGRSGLRRPFRAEPSFSFLTQGSRPGLSYSAVSGLGWELTRTFNCTRSQELSGQEPYQHDDTMGAFHPPFCGGGAVLGRPGPECAERLRLPFSGSGAQRDGLYQPASGYRRRSSYSPAGG